MLQCASPAGKLAERQSRSSARYPCFRPFNGVVEMHSHEELYMYTDVTRSVDALPAASVQVRRHLHGKMVLTNQQLPVKSPPRSNQEH